MKNKIVGSLKEVDYRGMFPLAVIYNKPSDFPTAYVVRIWDVNSPTNIVFVASSLEECRKDIRAAGFTVWFDRSKEDDTCIVETWMR